MMTERLDELKKQYEIQMEVLEEMSQKLGKDNQNFVELMTPRRIANQISHELKDYWIDEYQKTGRDAPEEMEYIETCIKKLYELLNRYKSDIDPMTYELKGGIAKTTDPPPAATDPSSHSKINWQGSQTQLVYLWEGLFRLGVLPKVDEYPRWQILVNHFACKGHPLKVTTLKQTAQNLLDKEGGLPRGGEDLKLLLDNTESLKD